MTEYEESYTEAYTDEADCSDVITSAEFIDSVTVLSGMRRRQVVRVLGAAASLLDMRA